MAFPACRSSRRGISLVEAISQKGGRISTRAEGIRGSSSSTRGNNRTSRRTTSGAICWGLASRSVVLLCEEVMVWLAASRVVGLRTLGLMSGNDGLLCWIMPG